MFETIQMLILIHLWCTPADQGILTAPQVDKCRATLINCMIDKKSFFELQHRRILLCVQKTKVSDYQ